MTNRQRLGMGFALAALAACSAIGSREPRPSRVAAAQAPREIEPARLSAHVRALADDALEGRGPGTAGEEKTLAYLIEQFQLAGAQPAGVDGGWTQPVEMLRFTLAAPPRVELASADARCAGEVGKALVAWTRQAPANGGARGDVELRGAPLVFVGHGVHAPDRGWDDYAGVELRGAVAVVLVNDPDWQDESGPFDGAAMTYHGRWTYKLEELARRGAVGALLVHDEAASGLGWSLVESSFGQPAVDIPRPPGERVALEGWLQEPTAAQWLACAGLDFEAQKAAARRPGFRAVPLPGLGLSTAFAAEVERTLTHNVVARIVGTSRPDETFVYTAHWDHLGRGTPDSTGDTIYNGALDNAGGVAGLLELARVFAAAPRLPRSVAFIATTLEERGLLGAEHFAAHPTFPLETVVGGINMDAVNLFGEVPTMVAAGFGRTDLEQVLADELGRRGRRLEANPNDAVGFYFRSDHFPFVKRGVPFLFPGSGWDIADRLANTRDPEVGTRFHQPSDEWGPDLDFGAAANDVDVYLAVGRRLAGSSQWPGWTERAEFRALRDASRARRMR